MDNDDQRDYAEEAFNAQILATGDGEITTPDIAGFRAWLATPEAYSFLDDAVLGCLLASYADEIAVDFGFDIKVREQRIAFKAAINAALTEDGL